MKIVALPVLAFTFLALLHASAAETGVTQKSFGACPQGPVTLYTLTNSHGLQVNLSNFGATVVGVVTPDRNGKFDDIVLGFDDVSTYVTAKLTFGSPGRFANRIKGGHFTLDGHVYELDKNAGKNTLHGGAHGFARQLWKAEIVGTNPPSVRFSRMSSDGEGGFPGNLQVSATFTLTNDNLLRAHYEATTDKPTVVNLTSHTLFNLSGAASGTTILDDVARVNAKRYTPNDAEGIPTGEIASVKGTPFDFRQPTVIGSRFDELKNQPRGYDLNYVLTKSGPGISAVGEVYDAKSGRVLDVFSDQPGSQFYTGNFFDGTLIGKGGVPYKQYCAFSMETEKFPDSPNHPNFPSAVLRPGETYQATTEYRFSIR